MMASIPRLDRLPHRNGWQLLVDDKPFFLRAGELQNSSLSDADYMEGAFKRLAEMNLNAVLGSVGWEQIEPVEGLFDFNELDKVIQLARNNGTKLVLLWFGSFKNGEFSLQTGLSFSVHRVRLTHNRRVRLCPVLG